MTSPTEARRTEPMRVVGLSLRTNNADEADPSTARIPGLWSRFREDDLFGQLGRIGAVGPPVGVYHNYASDVAGEFRLLAGREIPFGTAIPSELDSVEVPPGRYLVFPFTGEIPRVVIEGWQQVWEYFATPGRPERAYTADLEIYQSDGRGLEIWIALR